MTDRDLFAELAAKIRDMPEAARADLAVGLKDDLAVAWAPDPRNKPQVEAYYSPANVLLYGGAAGGGKTDLIVGLAATKHENSVIFRRQSIDLRGIEARIKAILGSPGWNGQKNYMQRPGLMIELGHLGSPGDEEDWQGRPHDLIAFDEGTQLDGARCRFVMGWLRAAKKPDGTIIRKRVVIATNPPMGGEGDWVIEMFGPWINPLHPLYGTVKPGELLWAVTAADGTTVWVDGPGEYQIEGEDITLEALSYTFIPSLLKDNPYLAGTGYEKQIMQLSEPWRTKLLKGDFMAGREDHAQQVIPGHWIELANERHARGRPKGATMAAIACDVAQGGNANTSIARLYGSWFDDMIQVPGRLTPDGPAVASLLIQHRRGMAEVVLDVTGGWGISARDHLKAMGIEVLEAVFSEQKNAGRTKDGKFKFGNRRAQMYWQLREAMDPDSGEDVGLPRDPKVKAQLTAIRFKIKGDKLFVEEKADIIKRIGSTLDEADAIVMAWWGRRYYAVSQAQRQNKRKNMNQTEDVEAPDQWGGCAGPGNQVGKAIGQASLRPEGVEVAPL